MTALGKMLVFLVLVLTLVWNGLVMNAYVTRTNWRAEAKRYQDKSKEAADSANSMKVLLETEREAAAERERALREERDRLYDQNAQLLKSQEDQGKQFSDAFGLAKEDASKQNIQQTNIKKLQDQVDQLDTLIVNKEKQLNDLTLQAQNDRVAAEKAKLEAEAQKQRAERFAARIQQLSDEIAELKRNGARPSTGIAAGPAGGARSGVPDGFRGTVVRREGDFVEFTPGLDAGVQPGAVLRIHRLGANPKFIGTLTVSRANPKEAVGLFKPPPGRAPGIDDLPRAGDELLPN